MRIGVDTGGTFTDCVILEDSRARIVKVFSTRDDAAQGILAGIRQLTGDQRESILEIVHGTTLGTNSLLERRGARVALVTTAGFEDLIEIGRQNRPRLYDLNVRREPPLVPRHLRLGVDERTGASGTILRRPSALALRRLREKVRRSGAESIALCFLFSFANPQNERAAARELRKLGVPVSVSHEILPEFREYERLSTLVINAFLAPRMGAYLTSLQRKVGERSALVHDAGRKPQPLPHKAAPGHVYVMQSSGGITTAERAGREPVRTILSGPAGGVVAAAWLARQLGIPRAISFDMGGTSTDVCLIEGQPRTTSETTLGGLPVAVPVLDVHSVGAGGGSLARVDPGGALRVGPESAGAEPGPICYSRGGALPTVTDANLLLGRLDPNHFLGGAYLLDAQASMAGFATFLRGHAREIQTPADLARGIVAVANANMERALRVISVERGHDPRDFALICFGGAGGLHAADLARSLGIPQVIVPPSPGAFSALGILLSDIVKDVSHSLLLPVPHGDRRSDRQIADLLRGLDEQFARLERDAREELRRDHFSPELARVERRLDVRYVGQAYELPVPFTPDFSKRFHREHEKAYGYAHAGRPIEVVNLRVRLTIPTAKPAGPARRMGSPGKSSRALVKKRPVWFGSRFLTTPLFDRERLAPGARLRGPAVVVEYSSTTVVPPDFVLNADRYSNLVLSQHAH